MIKIAICDDEPMMAQELAGHLADYMKENLITDSLAQRTAEDIVIQRGTGCEVVLLSDIVYCEVLGRKIYLHKHDGTVSDYYDKLEDLEQRVDGRFFKCHRSFLVNLDYVRGCQDGQVLLDQGECIPASRLRERELTQALLRHMKERGIWHGLFCSVSGQPLSPCGTWGDAYGLYQPPHREETEKMVLCRLFSPPGYDSVSLGQTRPWRDAPRCRGRAGALRTQPLRDGKSAVCVLAGRRAVLLHFTALLRDHQLGGGGALSPLHRESAVLSPVFGGTAPVLCAVRWLLLCCAEAPGLDGGQPDTLYRASAVSRAVFLCRGAVYPTDCLQLFCPYGFSGGGWKTQYAAAPASHGSGGSAVYPVCLPPAL